jgi:hypothetical protein
MAKKIYQDSAMSGLYGLDDGEPLQPVSRLGAWLSGFVSGVAITLLGVACYQALVTVRLLP